MTKIFDLFPYHQQIIYSLSLRVNFYTIKIQSQYSISGSSLTKTMYSAQYKWQEIYKLIDQYMPFLIFGKGKKD